MRVALLFRSFGPYHLARLKEVARRTAVLALEFVDLDPEYGWEVAAEKRRLAVQSLVASSTGNKLASARRRLDEELDRYRPSAIAIPGWSEPFALHTLSVAYDREIPTILMSDSRADDAKRNFVGEKLKAQIVK